MGSRSARGDAGNGKARFNAVTTFVRDGESCQERQEQLRCTSQKNGAPGRVRTRDPLITNQVLYQLSYKGNACQLPDSEFV